MIPGETVLSQQELGMEADPHLSDFRVMHSGGGYYIGTVFQACGVADCKECSDYVFGDRVLVKGQELAPGSRETDYFETRKAAEDALEVYKKTGDLPNERY